jgi:hypothetical protein
MKSRPKGRDSRMIQKKKLGSTTLTVAILIFFVVFILLLTALFRRVLTGLAALLTLPLLSGLALLALSDLVTLLTFFLHIVCHKSFPPEKVRAFPHL